MGKKKIFNLLVNELIALARKPLHTTSFRGAHQPDLRKLKQKTR